MMALRSGLETEATWALNALNVMLYDDCASPTMLNHTPGLLNLLVEHFRALLSLLYPKVFEVLLLFSAECLEILIFFFVMIKMDYWTVVNSIAGKLFRYFNSQETWLSHHIVGNVK